MQSSPSYLSQSTFTQRIIPMDEEKLREVQKFTDFVRNQIRDNGVDLVATKSDFERYDHRHRGPSNPDESQLYGLVEKEIFLKVLSKYEQMQKDRSTMDSPVTCDNIMGNNLSSYLHSRLGFHNFGSTPHLMRKLKIKDPNRYSFLGGISNMEPPPEERISILRQIAKRAEIDKYILKARHLLNLGQVADVQKYITECSKMDPDNPEIYALNGSLQLAMKNIPEAISILRRAIDRRGLRDPESIKRDLSQAHSCEGYRYSCQQKWLEAIREYEQSVRWDPTNQVASHQLNFCKSQYNSTQARVWGNQMQNYERRK